MGKKVLYINAESFQTFESVIDKSGAFNNGVHVIPNDGRTFTDGERVVQNDGRAVMTDEVKRAIAAESPNASNVILANVRKGKFDYIPQSMDVLSTYQVTEDKIFHVVKSLQSGKIYDHIVIEFESGLSAARLTLLSECERLVIVTGQGREEDERRERFIKLLSTGLVEIVYICARCRNENSIDGNAQICEYIPEKSDIADIFESREGMNYYRKAAEAVM